MPLFVLKLYRQRIGNKILWIKRTGIITGYYLVSNIYTISNEQSKSVPVWPSAAAVRKPLNFQLHPSDSPQLFLTEDYVRLAVSLNRDLTNTLSVWSGADVTYFNLETLVRQSACVLDDLLDGSDISFDPPAETAGDTSSTAKYSWIPNVPVIRMYRSVEREDVPVCSTTTTLTPTHKKPAKENSGTPVAVGTSRTSLKSNRTVTRDIRRTEFNEMLKAEKGLMNCSKNSLN